jgi:hypothetical protein
MISEILCRSGRWEGRVGAPAPDDPTRFEGHGSCGGSAERFRLFVPCALEDRDICPTALIFLFCEPAMIRS